ncbi:hypothetical protein KX928_06740 [Roseobacter sp. YSTF-M11]|uniref:Uncharacterized protein n=1 Tax=Roseobacter insulae TaxID=2859783 RepID=A0A9X1FU60_9RHOB|nr:hypothetical protein [Roseobacter insulae]MBW4707479.1 hypothetical protein [Roseobacter insulae]
MIGLFDSQIEKCDIAGVPVPIVIHINDDLSEIGNFVPTAHKCQFINCTFFNVILVDQPFRQQSHATHLFASITRLETNRSEGEQADLTGSESSVGQEQGQKKDAE